MNNCTVSRSCTHYVLYYIYTYFKCLTRRKTFWRIVLQFITIIKNHFCSSYSIIKGDDLKCTHFLMVLKLIEINIKWNAMICQFRVKHKKQFKVNLSCTSISRGWTTLDNYTFCQEYGPNLFQFIDFQNKYVPQTFFNKMFHQYIPPTCPHYNNHP